MWEIYRTHQREREMNDGKELIVSRKMQVRHARLEQRAPNKSTSISCHKPVNLLGIDNSEDRRCVVEMWLGSWREKNITYHDDAVKG